MTVKKKRKKMTVREKKIRAQIRSKIRKQVKEQEDGYFNETTLEQRQEFIRLMHTGKTLGEAMAIVGIEYHPARVVYYRNIKTVKYQYLEDPDKVK